MKLFLSALAVCLAGAANATTVTFDHTYGSSGPIFGSYNGSSNGFSYIFSDLYLFGNYLSLHDDGGVTTTSINQQDGNAFTPVSVDLLGFSNIYTTGSGPKTDPSWYTAGIAPPLALSFQGVIGNQVVATHLVSTSNMYSTNWGTTTFSSAFAGIDQLVLSLLVPASAPRDNYGITTPGQVWCLDWCGEYRVDNLVVSQVAAVPLPASGLLLLGAMLGMLGYRRFT